MGWYYYLEDQLRFPFRAKRIAPRPISPLRKGEAVEVVELAPGDECRREIFVTVKWERRTRSRPSQATATHRCQQSHAAGG
jgi:hypothetical protein